MLKTCKEEKIKDLRAKAEEEKKNYKPFEINANSMPVINKWLADKDAFEIVSKNKSID